MGDSACSASVPSLPPPRPKSPPEYPDLYGKRRQLAKVQILEREIGFLEEELKSVEGLRPASRSCKEIADFVTGNPDPLIPTTKKDRKSCRFWKWLCGTSCFDIQWICCCFKCPHLHMPRCCCDCNLCSPDPCISCSMPKCSCSMPKCCCCSMPKCSCSMPKCCCCSMPKCSCSMPKRCCCSMPKCSCCSMPKCDCSCCLNTRCFKTSYCRKCCCIPKCPSCSVCFCFTRRCSCCYPKCPKVNICSPCDKSCCCYPCYLCY